MTTASEMIQAIKDAADSTGSNQIRIPFGNEGSHLEDAAGETRPTGQAWDESEVSQVWPTFVRGIAAFFDGAGAGPANIVNIGDHYELAAGVGIVQIDAIKAGGIQIDLGSATVFGRGRIVRIKDAAGECSGAKPVVVVSSSTIDGAPAVSKTAAWCSLVVYSDGVKWLILS